MKESAVSVAHLKMELLLRRSSVQQAIGNTTQPRHPSRPRSHHLSHLRHFSHLRHNHPTECVRSFAGATSPCGMPIMGVGIFMTICVLTTTTRTKRRVWRFQKVHHILPLVIFVSPSHLVDVARVPMLVKHSFYIMLPIRAGEQSCID